METGIGLCFQCVRNIPIICGTLSACLEGVESMGELLRKTLLDLVTSKKAIATVAGLIISAAAKYGFGLDETTVIEILAAVAAYVVGQGVADAGKEAVKLQNAAAAQSRKTQQVV